MCWWSSWVMLNHSSLWMKGTVAQKTLKAEGGWKKLRKKRRMRRKEKICCSCGKFIEEISWHRRTFLHSSSLSILVGKVRDEANVFLMRFKLFRRWEIRKHPRRLRGRDLCCKVSKSFETGRIRKVFSWSNRIRVFRGCLHEAYFVDNRSHPLKLTGRLHRRVFQRMPKSDRKQIAHGRREGELKI